MNGRVRADGMLIILLSVWGGIVPFVGPYFGFGAGTDAWTWTVPFATLNVAAAVGAVVGGLLLLSGRSATARVGGVLGLAGGMWFVLGPVFQPLWHQTSPFAAGAAGSTWIQVAKVLGYHDGIGLLIAAFAAYALGVLSRPRPIVASSTAPVTTTEVHEAA